MDDLKKVIRGLTCCQTINEYCDECPYNRISYDQCSKVMHKDALKLLKEQKPVKPVMKYYGPDEMQCVLCNERKDYLKNCKYCDNAVKCDD